MQIDCMCPSRPGPLNFEFRNGRGQDANARIIYTLCLLVCVLVCLLTSRDRRSPSDDLLDDGAQHGQLLTVLPLGTSPIVADPVYLSLQLLLPVRVMQHGHNEALYGTPDSEGASDGHLADDVGSLGLGAPFGTIRLLYQGVEVRPYEAGLGILLIEPVVDIAHISLQ